MDKELIKKYLSMFQVTLIILVVTLVISIALLCSILPQVSTLFASKSKLAETQNQLTQKQNELQSVKEEIERKKNEVLDTSDLRAFYKNIKNTGNSSSEILADEIKEIHDLISYYGIKVYKENNEYDIESDPFYAADKNAYSICRMNIELFSTYMKFQSFLSDIYKHPHFLDIESIEVNPYKKDKTILNIKLSLVLYAEKSTGSSPDAPATPTVQAGEGEAIPPAPGAESLDLNIELPE